MSHCECGCGSETQGSEFAPGHDQKLRTQLEARVGGLLTLRELVDAMESYSSGLSTAEDFTRVVRRAYARKVSA